MRIVYRAMFQYLRESGQNQRARKPARQRVLMVLTACAATLLLFGALFSGVSWLMGQVGIENQPTSPPPIEVILQTEEMESPPQ